MRQFVGEPIFQTSGRRLMWGGGIGARQADPAWRALPWIFLVAAMAASLFAALRTPPLMGPDETAHVLRADMLTLGELMPHRFTAGGLQSSGAPVDQALLDVLTPFDRLAFHPERKARPADFAQAEAGRWDGRTIQVDFFNTAVYSALLYLPATAGLACGKLSGLSVAHTLTLARIMGAAACLLLGFLALRLAGEGRAVMAVLLLLPMSTFLFGVINQDGPTLVLTALGAALTARGARMQRPLSGPELWGAAAAFALAGLAKPPYALFALALLWTQTPSRAQRRAAALIPLAVGLAWAVWMQAAVATTTHFSADIDPSRQAQHLLRHPGVVIPLAVHTAQVHGADYFRQFIGVLGWLDTLLPRPFYAAAAVVIGLAVVIALAGRDRSARVSPGLPLAVVVIALAAGAGVFGALYLQWTKVGGPFVEGVQGRYLLPIALFLCAALDSAVPASTGPKRLRLHRAGAALTALLGALGVAVMVHALSVRYYG